MTMTILAIVNTYRHLCPEKLAPFYDQTYLTIRLIFGFTEPDKLNFVANSRYSTGVIVECFILVAFLRTFFRSPFDFLLSFDDLDFCSILQH